MDKIIKIVAAILTVLLIPIGIWILNIQNTGFHDGMIMLEVIVFTLLFALLPILATGGLDVFRNKD